RLELHVAVLETALTHGDAEGKADEVRVLEFDAGALVPVVDEGLQAGGGELLLEARHRVDHLLRGAELDDVYGVRRHRGGPADAVVVVVLLDDRRHEPGDADAVATHDDGALVALLV